MKKLHHKFWKLNCLRQNLGKKQPVAALIKVDDFQKIPFFKEFERKKQCSVFETRIYKLEAELSKWVGKNNEKAMK